MPLWEDQQEVRSRVCDFVGGSWKKGTRHPTRPKQKETYGWQDWDKLGRRLKLGIKPLIESVIYKISPRWRCHSPAQSPEAYSEGQERGKEGKGKGRRACRQECLRVMEEQNRLLLFNRETILRPGHRWDTAPIHAHHSFCPRAHFPPWCQQAHPAKSKRW